MNYKRIVSNALERERKRHKNLSDWIFPMSEANVNIILNNLAVEIIIRLEKRSYKTGVKK